MQFTSPAGWIPPEFREIVYGERTEADLEAIQQTASIFDLETGERRPLTEEELDAFGVRPIAGVKDTRTGQIQWARGFSAYDARTGDLDGTP